uniref:Agenet domain-containing protein n=1 Tax=Nelumbo nucifera TaxID=4432 RepID=A0A822YQR9_NELNU|nr:TPA_asm: hypothetical protein HUJ06_007175 [Nelumbo nucifera]
MEHKHTMVEEEEEEEENHHSYLYAESEVEILYNCKWYPAIILRAKQLTEQDQDEGERCCYEIEIDYRLLMDKEKWFLHRKAGGSKRKWMDPLPLYLMDKISCKNILYEYCSHMIRPRPQPSSVRWERGDEVEAFFGTFWLCGEVTQLLNDSKYIVTFYSHFSEEFEESELRMVQNWTGREWERIRARDIDSKCVQFRCFDRPSYIEFEEKFRRAGRFLQGYYIGDDEEIHYSETSSSSNGLILTMNTAQEGSGSLPTELLPQSQIELCHLLYNDDDDDDDDYYYDFIGYHAIIKKSKQIYEHYEIECELLIDINKWMLHSNVGSLKRLDYDPLPLFLSHIKGLRIEVDYYWEPLNEQHVQDWKEGERVEAFFGSFWKNGQIIGVLKDSRYLVKFKKLGVDVFGQRDLRPLGNSQYPQYRILSGDIWEQEIKRARKLLESLYIDDESSVKTSTSDTATTTMQGKGN